MTLDELIQEVNGLSAEELGIVRDVVARRMEGTAKVALPHDLGNRYVNAMNNIIGRNILEDKRDSFLVWGRHFVIYQLYKDGLTEAQIGRIIGKDHSTINYSKNRVKDVMDSPSSYKQEIKLWTEFQLAII